MTGYELYLLSLLIGQVMPFIVDAVNKYISSAKIRFLASLLFSFIVAILYNYDQLVFGNVGSYLLSALIVWTSSQSAYKLYYEGSKAQINIRFSKRLIPLPF